MEMASFAFVVNSATPRERADERGAQAATKYESYATYFQL